MSERIDNRVEEPLISLTNEDAFLCFYSLGKGVINGFLYPAAFAAGFEAVDFAFGNTKDLRKSVLNIADTGLIYGTLSSFYGLKPVRERVLDRYWETRISLILAADSIRNTKITTQTYGLPQRIGLEF